MTIYSHVDRITRRRRRRSVPMVRKSFTLHEDTADALDAAVAAGEAESLSAFVEAAIQERLRRSKRNQLRRAYEQAAEDPDFIDAVQMVTKGFDVAAADGLGDA